MKGKWNVFQWLGLVLILISLCLLVGSELLAGYHQKKAEALTDQLSAMLPQRTAGTPEDYSDPEMPILQLEGQDFSGLIQIPAFGVTLPIGSRWDRNLVSQYPCRFWGSAYDSTLVLGGKDREGQFDFCTRMDHGDVVMITDMTGTQFRYTVSRIDRSKDASAEILSEDAWDLTLFARDSGSMDYIIVRCQFSP